MILLNDEEEDVKRTHLHWLTHSLTHCLPLSVSSTRFPRTVTQFISTWMCRLQSQFRCSLARLPRSLLLLLNETIEYSGARALTHTYVCVCVRVRLVLLDRQRSRMNEKRVDY